jgi:hypothetical protein
MTSREFTLLKRFSRDSRIESVRWIGGHLRNGVVVTLDSDNDYAFCDGRFRREFRTLELVADAMKTVEPVHFV